MPSLQLGAAAALVATLIGLGLAGCSTSQPPALPGGGGIYQSQSAPGATLDKQAAAAMISELRRGRGLGPVTLDVTLNRMAEEQAAAMARTQKLEPRKLRRHVRSSGIAHSGYRNGGMWENVGAGHDTLADAFTGWRSSPTHLKNMMQPKAARMGIAVARAPGSRFEVFWTLVLADPNDPRPQVASLTPAAQPRTGAGSRARRAATGRRRGRQPRDPDLPTRRTRANLRRRRRSLTGFPVEPVEARRAVGRDFTTRDHLLEMGEDRQTRGSHQTLIEPAIEFGDDLRNPPRPLCEPLADRRLAHQPVAEQMAREHARILQRGPVSRQVEVLGPREQFPQRVEVRPHRAVRRGDDRGRPRHDVVARQDELRLREREGEVVRGVAGSLDRDKRPAGSVDAFALAEL